MDFVSKVLFDLSATQSSNESPIHGGGVYAKYVFYASLKYKDNMICFYDQSRKLDQDIVEACDAFNIPLFSIESKKDINKLISRNDVEVFYSALPYDYHDLNLSNKRFVGTVHGLRSIECPSDKFEYVYRNNLKEKIILHIKKIIKGDKLRVAQSKSLLLKLMMYEKFEIITDSLHSKYSMMGYYPILNDKKISVFRCPYDFDSTYERIEKKEGDYFLLINSNRWVKNNFRAILALDQLFSEKRISKKVMVLGVGDIDFRKYIINQDKFQFEGYVEENILNSYFSNAYAFIYPTLNEGYGYPPIKAMEYGVPVIASAITSVTEVCGDAALYFSPFSIDEMKTRIITLEYQGDLRGELIRKGFSLVDSLKESNDNQLNDIVNYIFNTREKYA